MGHKVVLLHGYFRTQRDMVDLKENLELFGYEPILINLPLTFETIEYATKIFQSEINVIIESLEKYERISLVGHSTGGLIIRLFLSNTKYINKINRCVLIGTPNGGSQLADIACKTSKVVVNTFKTLKSLTSENVEELPLININSVQIGAIVGNKNNLLLGKLIDEESDGRVEIGSAIYEELHDYIILPYNHNEIHHRVNTAKFVNQFLSTGKFNI